MTLVGTLDFVVPTDIGDTADNNTYEVTITATDSFGNATDQTLAAVVNTADERGQFRLSRDQAEPPTD